MATVASRSLDELTLTFNKDGTFLNALLHEGDFYHTIEQHSDIRPTHLRC